MLYIFLFFLFIVGFNLYSSKFANPNQLIFLFGKKGSGKSTFMVRLMLQHIKRGWTVYTNMRDVIIPGVRLFDAQDLSSCTPAEHSVLFIDEAGLLWDNRNFKTFSSGLTEFFKLQRKYKCKVYINSQSFDVDKKLRDLTDVMYLQSNIGNVIGITRPILRTVRLVNPDDGGESRISDGLRFGSLFSWRITWLPSYFKYFDSFRAPAREPIKYDLVPDDPTLRVKSVRFALKILRKDAFSGENTHNDSQNDDRK